MMGSSSGDKNKHESKVIDVDAEEAAAAAAAAAGDNNETGEDDGREGSPTTGCGRAKQNRLEKKSRKALSRMNLKPVNGVVKVTIKKSKHLLLSILNPEVFKSPTSETYVIFGDAKIDDGVHSKAAQAFNPSDFLNVVGMSNLGKGAEGKDEPSEEGIDSTGIAEKDIELVMAQGSCSRTKAILALKAKNNDIVEAILDVTAG